MSAAKALLVSDQARNDLTEIWLYIAEDNFVAADKTIRSLNNAFDLLFRNPAIGKLRTDIRTGHRSFAVLSYLIFYSFEDRKLLIKRVIHGSRDLALELGESYPETFRMSEFPTDPS